MIVAATPLYDNARVVFRYSPYDGMRPSPTLRRWRRMGHPRRCADEQHSFPPYQAGIEGGRLPDLVQSALERYLSMRSVGVSELQVAMSSAMIALAMSWPVRVRAMRASFARTNF